MSVSNTTSGLGQSVPARDIATVGNKLKIDTVTLCLFTSAIFTSATLLFVVQPMVGKILLPKLGGAPAVWNTCMVFFQATLLAGYLSAHLLTKYLSFKKQVVVFATALLMAMFTLPIAVGPEWVDRLLTGTNPSVWLLSVLLFRVAPVFFVLSITSPLLQKWFAKSGHAHAHDPYFLYAASNVGSILSLLAYPFVIEVNWGVTTQTETWMLGFGFFAVLATVCGVASWYGNRHAVYSVVEHKQRTTDTNTVAPGMLTWSRRAHWILMSFIPSSLMLGVTTYISTDVASIPLIWVVPLAMYLLTFVLAFSRRQLVSAYWSGRIASLLILAITVTIVGNANDPPSIIVPLHLMMFFAVALFCHQRLASDRPSTDHLTDFYLWLSVGGVLGGIFNALVAPSLFVTLLEYPLVMIAASYLRDTRTADQSQDESARPGKVIAFGAAVFGLTLLLYKLMESVPEAWTESALGIVPISVSHLQTLVAFGVPVAIVLSQLDRRAFFSVGLLSVFAVHLYNVQFDASIIERGRNFYGTIATATEELEGGSVTKMFHGNTVHGWQWNDAARRNVPLTYYGESSGVNKVLKHTAAAQPEMRIGAVGLGAGTIAASLRPGDSIVYYEINPQVVDHAERHFSFLDDARLRGVDVDVRLGDARLVLEAEQRSERLGRYDILVVDAFSSDSIPAHLITHECLQTYLAHTRPGGIMAFHISNRYLNLEPVLAALARRNKLAAFSYKFYDVPDGQSIDEQTGETKSCWILMSQDASTIESMQDAPHLAPIKGRQDMRLWTDDFTNVISAFESRL